MAQKVLKVDFKDGCYLAGTVKQSVGVKNRSTPTMSMSGLTLVTDIEANQTGVRIVMLDRIFIVPWSSIASLELMPEAQDPLAEANAQKAASGKR
jgi:hypothetical protein